ncbi:hypothetical protein [Sinorhizobium meliloti]|jgi:hypothetical protein|uniref:hypothetical protein n=1 Tax=Rhizobium meliloti TaxID=382 RepID=UPI00036A30F6|nr:hypothetical protein [Sinorhizobium meliloti]MDE4604799.1 hypothetical protein [Sinorhizobium meliloti]RVG06486.1 hypothetical protein CN234_21690 [Sinorhizobium meliloti]RVG97946.1 hypothetical protein CN210_31060 [Sinorhizobium meliloti]
MSKVESNIFGDGADKHELESVEIDELSFLVRAQKFRIAGTAMRRTSIPLATEYAIRLIHLIPEITAEQVGAYFGFEHTETSVLLQDILDTGLVTETQGRLVLSARGYEAVSPLSDDIELFSAEDFTATQAFDLIALAPIEDNVIQPGIARLIPEIALPDRIAAAKAASRIPEAFEMHFLEWRQRLGGRLKADDFRFQSIQDVQLIKTFPAPFHIPVRLHLEEPAVVEPDFGNLRQRGRAGSRTPLIEALSDYTKKITCPGDYDQAFNELEAIDGGVLSRNGLRDPTQQASWAKSCYGEAPALVHPFDPGLKLIGSSASSLVKRALTMWTKEIETDSSPLFWLPPQADYWGRSLSFATLLRDLSAQEPGGLVLLARGGSDHRSASHFRRLFGARERQEALFERCIAITSDAPRALEVVLKPNSWVMVLLHAPDAKSGYPLPVGYISADRVLVEDFEGYFARLASSATILDPVLWHKTNETASGALDLIDQALRIETTSD